MVNAVVCVFCLEVLIQENCISVRDDEKKSVFKLCEEPSVVQPKSVGNASQPTGYRIMKKGHKHA